MRLVRPTPRKSADLVAMIRQCAPDWTPERLRALIRSGEVPDDYVRTAAVFIVDKPHLWNVSDDEFIAAVALVDPACAREFNCPAGLDLMHRISRRMAVRTVLGAFGLGGG